MTEHVFEQLAKRTNGDVYIGVVGPVRVGKSTFVKKVMEHLVLPNIEDEEERLRAFDALPQSSPGLTIMTAEPKFVPAQSTQVNLKNGDVSFRIRLADCVGYIIPGAQGYENENGPKLVQTPWFNEPIPFEEAAKVGTNKVIHDHANIGVVVTTDGTVNGIARESVENAERQIIEQLTEIGKPFVIVLNSEIPAHENTIRLRNELFERYNVPVYSVSIEHLTKQDISFLMEEALYEFPLTKIELKMEDWIQVLDSHHPLQQHIQHLKENLQNGIEKVRDIDHISLQIDQDPYLDRCELLNVDAGEGCAHVCLHLLPNVYEQVCAEYLDVDTLTQKEWLLFIQEAISAREQHQKFSEAIAEARKGGYGVTLPSLDEFEPSEPELIKQNNFFGVKMLAKAHSYHIIRIDMTAEFAPLIGSEFHSQQLLRDLTYAFHHDREKLWETQLFGTSLHEVLRESIKYKTDAIPEIAKDKMRLTIERMVNAGDKGIVTFVI